MRFAPVRTARLAIREFVPADRPALDGFVADPTALELMLHSLATPEEADAFLALALAAAGAEPRVDYHLAVDLLPEAAGAPRFIGSAALMGLGGDSGEAELGYYFLRSAWGRGYAREAARALVDFGFRELALHRVWGMCHTRNEASAKVMAALGMAPEGTLREHRRLRGQWRSSHIFGVLDREWAGAAGRSAVY